MISSIGAPDRNKFIISADTWRQPIQFEVQCQQSNVGRDDAEVAWKIHCVIRAGNESGFAHDQWAIGSRSCCV